MILVVGNSGTMDIQSFELVRSIWNESGVETAFFAQDNCLEEEYLNYKIDENSSSYFFSVKGKRFNLNEFDGIWYLKPHLPESLWRHENPEFRHYIHRQFFEMRSALWSIASDKKWLNDPWAVRRAENKIYQLEVASECGLNVPDTRITSDPQQVIDFYEEKSGNLVVKTLGVSPIPDKVLYTNRVTEDSIEEIESVKLSPAIFQEEVKKSHEMRITVVGDDLFAAKIHSQADPKTALDWRREPELNDFSVEMEQANLPDNVAQSLQKYMSELELDFGCIDMIVTPDGDYVFLEINPNGQWYFAQTKTGNNIARAIAHTFME